ncbi:hypothetical protein AOC05_04900 [Arthrobacter alpinus]|uniref:Uncharacterized protein n=1 Tax=Arthrobacter alpinus TaxID=656366 RepID=A0A0M4QVM2_9MICC|nr:hypothetical protein [Arthrobacter alpinus]ALE91811.1 hypothetical protein AOC05_04900 [Arthrobacter alpinus]
MTNNSGIPRPFGVTDARRRQEEEARRREQSTSARNTSSTTVGSGGRLDIDGGDLTVMNGGSAVVKDGGVWRIEDGGGAELTGDGKIRVVGQGNYLGTPYEVSMTVESFETDSGPWGKVLSPGLNFKSVLTPVGGYTRLYSSGGNSLRGEVYDPDIGRSRFSVSPSAGSIFWVQPDEYREISVANNMMRVVHYSHLTSVQTGMQESGGNLTVGHSSTSAARALLRTKTDGWLSIESKGTAEAALTMPGDGTVDITGTFTVNGSPVGGAVSSVNTKTGDVVLAKGDIGLGNVDNTSDANKPVSTATGTALDGKAATTHAHTIAQVTGLQTALDNKQTASDSGWISPAYGTPWVDYGGGFGGFQYRRLNGVLYIRGTIKGGTTGTTITTLPTGYRPIPPAGSTAMEFPALVYQDPNFIPVTCYAYADGRINYAGTVANWSGYNRLIILDNFPL